MFKAPFSFNGRIRRTEYGISFIIYFSAIFVISLAVSMIAASGQNDATPLIMLVAMVPVLWFLWAQGAKRCHDVGNSGWFQIIPFYFLYLLFGEGHPGANEYGVNPKESDSYVSQHYTQEYTAADQNTPES